MIYLQHVKQQLNQIKQNGFKRTDRSKLSKLDKKLNNSPPLTTESDKKLLDNLKITITDYIKIIDNMQHYEMRNVTRRRSRSPDRMTLAELSSHGGKMRKYRKTMRTK